MTNWEPTPFGGLSIGLLLNMHHGISCLHIACSEDHFIRIPLYRIVPDCISMSLVKMGSTAPNTHFCTVLLLYSAHSAAAAYPVAVYEVQPDRMRPTTPPPKVVYSSTIPPHIL